MKYAIVPPPITVTDPLGRAQPGTVTLREYAIEHWLNDPVRWQKPPTRMASLVKVLPEFEKATGETMRFEDADFAILLEIVQAPATMPRPLYALQLAPFVSAILSATDKEPTP